MSMARYSSSRLSHKGQAEGVVSDRGFLKLIESVEATIGSLDEKRSPAVQEILAGEWLTMSGKVVAKMEYFLSELLVVRPVFCKTVVRELILKFIVCTANLDGSAKQDEMTLQETKMFAVLHRNLKKIFESFPMFEEYGVSTMSSLFPYMTKGPHVHFCYVSNLLSCIEYMPASKMQILHVILNKLCKIDATIPRHDVENYSEHLQAAQELADRVKLENGGYTELILDDDDGFLPNPLIETLDVCLQVLFKYLETEFKPLVAEGEKAESKKVEAINYLKLCLNRLFEREILPSFGISHVQFLFFFLTSHQSEFAQILLDWLWRKVDTVGTPMVLRVQSMSHISGILSRGQFVTVKTVKRWLSKLSDWANEYATQKSIGSHWSTINLQSHGCFYAVCQTIFYVVAFRNKELLGNRKASAFMRTLNLGRLITCDLNPLKACSKTIAEAFVEAANQHQISYCRTILERNQRSTLPTVISGSDDVGNPAWQVTSATLDTFFPYDPFLLSRSRQWIDPIYRMFDPYFPEIKIEKEEREEEENRQLGGDSSEMMDLSCSFNSDSSFSRAIKANTLMDYLEMM